MFVSDAYFLHVILGLFFLFALLIFKILRHRNFHIHVLMPPVGKSKGMIDRQTDRQTYALY